MAGNSDLIPFIMKVSPIPEITSAMANSSPASTARNSTRPATASTSLCRASVWFVHCGVGGISHPSPFPSLVYKDVKGLTSLDAGLDILVTEAGLGVLGLAFGFASQLWSNKFLGFEDKVTNFASPV